MLFDMSKISRRLGAVCASVITAIGLFSAPAVQAQDLSSQLPAEVQSAADSLNDQAEDAVWDARNNARRAVGAVDQVDPSLTKQMRYGIDQAADTVYPGIVDRRTSKPAARPQAAKPAAEQAPAFDYGSCPKDAKVCVDIAGQRSWLQNNGKVYYGDVRVSTGRVGQETPKGTFHVTRQVRDEISYEFNNAPMPFATYFTNNGHAFHEGTPDNLSAGCVRMYRADAEKYFNDLQVGDKVYIY